MIHTLRTKPLMRLGPAILQLIRQAQNASPLEGYPVKGRLSRTMMRLRKAANETHAKMGNSRRLLIHETDHNRTIGKKNPKPEQWNFRESPVRPCAA